MLLSEILHQGFKSQLLPLHSLDRLNKYTLILRKCQGLFLLFAFIPRLKPWAFPLTDRKLKKDFVVSQDEIYKKGTLAIVPEIHRKHDGFCCSVFFVDEKGKGLKGPGGQAAWFCLSAFKPRKAWFCRNRYPATLL